MLANATKTEFIWRMQYLKIEPTEDRKNSASREKSNRNEPIESGEERD